MRQLRVWCAIVTLALLAGAVAPAGATTLMRAGLDELTARNRTVILGDVIDAYSYWNSAGTFILTDVRVEVLDVLKGRMSSLDAAEPLTITLMGGTVGDLTTLILGGAELTPERSYVLFLNEENLPGAEGALTVRDHCQGVFEVAITGGDELRAVSQASRHPLVPDAKGAVLAPGGLDGLPLDSLIRDIREITTGLKANPRR